MAKVNTVLGPIDTKDLGPTLMHEHVLIANWSMRKAFSFWLEREEFIDYAVQKVLRAKAAGIKTIVDLTPINLGRDIDVIREVAEKAEMQIIAATGFYYFEEMWVRDKDAHWLAEQLIREVEYGIQGTDAKAAVIKCATDIDGITPANRHLLKVASLVHKATGVPISSHATVANYIGLAQQDVFEDEGVDLGKVIIGHQGDSVDADFIEAIIKRGSYVGMDRFGIDWMLPLEERVNTVKELCDRGHADKMVLSGDHSGFLDYKEEQRNVVHNPWAEYKAQNLDEVEVQFTYVPETVIPRLREKGVKESDIDLMMVGNPRRIFEGQ